MSLIKSLLCLGFMLLLCISPFIRVRCIRYFIIIEQFLEKNRKLVLFTVTGIYVVIALFLQLYHPIDGDEGQAWMIARDTASLKDMYDLMGYEGSPGLWHTLLRPFAQLGAPFNTIYVINYFFLFTAVIIWLWFAPYPLLVRILLPFSHYFLTEYSVNARSYALSACLLFAGLTLYKKYHHKWLLWASAFFLLANTNIHSTLLCCGFVMFLFLNWSFLKDKTDGKGILLTGAGILLAVIQVYPPNDLDAGLAAIKLQGSLKYITVSVITGTAELSVVIYFFFLLLAMLAIKNRFLLYSLIAVQLALFFLFLFKYTGVLRHHPFLLFSIIMFLWIGELKERYRSIVYLSLAAILCLNITTSVLTGIDQWKHWNNYTNKVRDSLRQELRNEPNTFIACHPSNIAATILPTLPVTQFFKPAINEWGSYVIWNQKRITGLFNADIVRNIADLPKEHKGYNKYLYLTVYKIPEDSARNYSITLIKEVTNEFLLGKPSRWSTFYLYRLAEK
jgi:hypothetical protein